MPGDPALRGALDVLLRPDSLLARIMGRISVAETYTCSYELNPDSLATLVAAGLRVAGGDAGGAVRAVELPGHPWFVATLYQPQRQSSAGRPHPLVAAFLAAARRA